MEAQASTMMPNTQIWNGGVQVWNGGAIRFLLEFTHELEKEGGTRCPFDWYSLVRHDSGLP